MKRLISCFVTVILALSVFFSSVPTSSYNSVEASSILSSEDESLESKRFVGKEMAFESDSAYETIPVSTVPITAVSQPTHYPDEVLNAYEKLCAYIQLNNISFEIPLENFYESYCLGNYTSMEEYMHDCYSDISALKASNIISDSSISTRSSSSPANSRWYYNTGTSPNQEPNYSKYNLLNIVEKGDIIHEDANDVTGHIAIVEGIYYNWVYGQYYIRLIEAIGYFSSSDGQADGVCRGILDDTRLDEREGTILRLKDEYKTSSVISSAISFCYSQIGKSYDIDVVGHGSSSSESDWYCSQLVWAAFLNQGVDLEDTYGSVVLPEELLESSKLEEIVSYSTIEEISTPEIKFLSAPTTTSTRISWYSISGASLYKIYRSGGAAGTYSLIDTTTDTSYTDTTVYENSSFCYKVSAVISGRESNTSKVRAVRTSFAAPYIMSLSSTSSKISIQWSPVYGATEYFVCRSTSENGTYSRTATTSTMTYTDSDIEAGKTYYYKVEAYNGSTRLESLTESVLPQVVNTPSIYYRASLATGSITVKWTFVLPATKYYVYRSTSTSSNYEKVGTTTKTVFVDTGLESGTKYYYKIIASNGTDDSQASEYKGTTAS